MGGVGGGERWGVQVGRDPFQKGWFLFAAVKTESAKGSGQETRQRGQHKTGAYRYAWTWI